jgi:hypothetical protein
VKQEPAMTPKTVPATIDVVDQEDQERSRALRSRWSLPSLFRSTLKSLLFPQPSQNNNNNNKNSGILTVPDTPSSKLRQLLFLLVTSMCTKRTESLSWLPQKHQQATLSVCQKKAPRMHNLFARSKDADLTELLESAWQPIADNHHDPLIIRGGSDDLPCTTSPATVGLLIQDSDNSSKASILMIPPGKSFDFSTTSAWNLSTNSYDAVAESMALCCDIVVVAVGDRDGPSLPMNALARGVQRRIDAGLAKGRLMIVSSRATNATWIQQQVMSEPFSVITPQHWDLFDFYTPERLGTLVPSDFVGSTTTTELLFPNDDHDGIVQLLPHLWRKVLMTIDADATEIHLEERGGSIMADLFEDMDSEKPAPDTLKVKDLSTKPPAVEGGDASIVIEQVLATAHEQLGVLETKMEEVALQQSEGYAMPLLDFGSMAQKIMESTESQLQSMEDSGKVSPSLRHSLIRGIRKQLERLYGEQLQALRNYYGQRYENILDKTKVKDDGTNAMEVEREWATSAEHMTQGFRAAAQNSIPPMFRNQMDQKDFAHAHVLEGLIKDMLESTERRKDEQNLSNMALDVGDDNDAKGGVGNMKRRSIKVPKWLERLAARTFVFGVNYLQGWLAWQGIKRAALERDRNMPKFPLF